MLWESFFRSQFVRVDFDLIKVKTLVTSQVATYLGKAGLIFKIPLRSLHTKGVFQMGYYNLRTGFIMLHKAERVELTELYNLTQSWSIPLRILFPSQWLLEWDQCTFHDKTSQTFLNMGVVPFSCSYFPQSW